MRILSWNVNGIRACAKRGLWRWLATSDADIVGLQEVRALPEQIPVDLRQPDGWHTHFAPAERKGYSGVGLYSQFEPRRVDTALGVSELDREGRLQIARFGKLVIANVYFPNGSGRDRDNGRVPYKLAFYRALFDRLTRLRRSGARVLVMGDWNTAHQEIDLARPQSNRDTSGFLDIEREELDRWVAAGWVDTFREFEPGPGHYTWWAQRQAVRERNVGWRIDFVLAAPAAMRYVRDAFHQPHVMGSDHCPIGVEVDNAILG